MSRSKHRKGREVPPSVIRLKAPPERPDPPLYIPLHEPGIAETFSFAAVAARAEPAPPLDFWDEAAEPPDPHKLAKDWADKCVAGHDVSIETYYTGVDGYVAGWLACERLYEGRSA